MRALIGIAGPALLLAACSGAAEPASSSATTTTASTGAPTRDADRDADPVVVRYRIERRTDDPATADFALVVTTTLDDPRGWSRAGFRLVEDPEAPYVIVLAEGPEVDALCLPYDTYGQFSCQNGPVVALNADRWRLAHPKWTGSPAAYREMVVNHEVGHLLGMHHPDVQCPAPGEPAPIMAQQSTELDGCLPNPWPLDDEIARAARHDLKLAPGYGA
ncbi:MAG: DUF3152 domain-containing protein [Actinobacteria bacterium]|nr:DUF3152 domain-containing protein [Actinomycetota bacterium]